MKNIKFLLTAAISAILIGCVNSDNYDTPDLSGECNDLTANKLVTDITNLANSTIQFYPQPDENNDEVKDIIEAYVTSSDEGGNFYKSISFVSLDGSVGFSVPVDSYNLYTKFEPGRKVFINLNNRYFMKDFGSTIIGSLYNNETPLDDTDDDVGRISGVEFESVITRSCTKVNEDELVNNITVAQAANDSYINKLIEFDAVQFTDESLGQNYYDEDVYTIGGGTNHEITDINGNKIVVRVSQYANFASAQIPSGNGKLRGVLTKFSSTYQFMIRTLEDVQMTNERVEIDLFPPLVGNNIQYLGSFTENFESYGTSSPGNRQFPNYINDANIGSRYWANTTFGGNKYIQMTSFGGTPENNRSLFIVPVDMTAANTLSFQSKAGFVNGSVLKVYYSTDYIVGGNINDATLVDITSNFTISPGQASGYPTNFTNSGNYNIPASVTGNGFFIFEYVGAGGGITTTMQIDNIVVN
ncbi:DUF5689 domain-containing protein [Flavobacterium sp.]|uniref:DUF5689 domain-containing protein n=1 Tax=Flavobacterium sp. TaxID=239 RepID=UPI00352737B7